jgi:hypothetical protein
MFGDPGAMMDSCTPFKANAIFEDRQIYMWIVENLKGPALSVDERAASSVVALE